MEKFFRFCFLFSGIFLLIVGYILVAVKGDNSALIVVGVGASAIAAADALRS